MLKSALVITGTYALANIYLKASNLKLIKERKIWSPLHGQLQIKKLPKQKSGLICEIYGKYQIIKPSLTNSIIEEKYDKLGLVNTIVSNKYQFTQDTIINNGNKMYFNDYQSYSEFCDKYNISQNNYQYEKLKINMLEINNNCSIYVVIDKDNNILMCDKNKFNISRNILKNYGKLPFSNFNNGIFIALVICLLWILCKDDTKIIHHCDVVSQ